jgi:2-keto-4-pentenoate hydratase/2-oxohepta-3-ene-1,7-dioic acid hydratase in catechol pathway
LKEYFALNQDHASKKMELWMKLASYVADGKEAFGAVTGEAVISLNERLRGRYAGLRQALAANALAEMRTAAEAAKPDHRLTDVKFLPPIPDPEKILCAGINYRSHAAETGRDLPKQPSMFIRLANTLTGHDGELIRPLVSQSFDFEGELAVVIGRAGRHIPIARALDHVAGYTCFVDGSVRDYQKFSVTSGKNFPGTGPLGPWIVTPDEIPDPKALMLVTRLNGQEVQKSSTDLLIYSVPQIIAFCSDFTPLVAGDVIATGTPEGVGHRRNPPLWMKPGDVLEVEISGIGTLRNRVVDERA